MESFREIVRSGVPLAFAHRGHNVALPENTMAAFQAAYDMGIRFLETDIRSSRDGVSFVFHDADLTRLNGDPRKIGDMSAAEIEAVRLDGSHPIPRLDDLLEAFPDAYFNLDAKSEDGPEAMAQVLLAHGAAARVCIGSFSDKRIRRTLKAMGQDVCHSLGTGSAVRFYLGARVGLRQNFGADCVQFPMRHKGVRTTDRQIVNFARKVGLSFHVWTVNSPDVMRYLMDLEVQGIMSDDTALLKSELLARNRWTAF